MDKLPAGITIRPAEKRDAAAIRRLIWRVGINPINLRWQRFLVAVDQQGRLIGCGQVKPHNDGTRELASLAVQPEWQGKGIGLEIVRRLLASQPPPLYLTCRASLEPYYQRYGFRSIPPQEMTPYYLKIWRLFQAARKLVPRLSPLLVMRRP